MGNNIKFIDLFRLRPHERTEPGRLRMLEHALSGGKLSIPPLIVDRKSMMILDGHHRCQALENLGFQRAPCILVDYMSDEIKVTFRRPAIRDKLIKLLIINNALSGRLFPNKTTKHRLKSRYKPKISINQLRK